jgi:pimeloyl-ACP methyl ester carboxylesterase
MAFAGLHWPDLTLSTSSKVLTPGVLLHGFLDHAGAWEGVARHLPGERIAIDHRGHGRSEHNPPGASYLFADYVADVDALLDVVSPDQPVHLVGHSMGGTMATLYAGARPGRVTSVVSLDGLGMADGVSGLAFADSDPVSERMVKFLDGVRSPPRHKPMPSVMYAAERLARAHSRIGPGWALRMAERSTVCVPGAGDAVTWSFDPAHRTRSPIPYRHSHHIPLLRRIACPVLSVHPGAPTFIAEDTAILEAAIPNLERRVIAGTSHMMHLEEPEAIAAHIVEFWSRIADT